MRISDWSSDVCSSDLLPYNGFSLTLSSMMTKVLFVCMGNICRSPSAEGVFRRLIDEAGLSEVIGVDSAGTHSFHIGEAPDARAQAAARKRGYDLSHRSEEHTSELQSLMRSSYAVFCLKK